MNLDELKQRIRRAFGPGLVNATPENVRALLGSIARERWQEEKRRRSVSMPGAADRIEIPSESASSYEEILRSFFAGVLEEDPEQAAIALWLFALDIAYSDLEDHYRERLERLFGDESEAQSSDESL